MHALSNNNQKDIKMINSIFNSEYGDLLGASLEAHEGGFKILAEGQFTGIVTGLTVSLGKKYQSEETEPKVTIVWQVHGKSHVDDEANEEGVDVVQYVKSTPMTISLADRAILCKMLMAWSKSKTPKEVVEKLRNEETGKFDLNQLLGRKGLLTIVHETYNGKTYPKISLVGVVKKSQDVEFDPKHEVPSFIWNPKNPLIQKSFLANAVLATAKAEMPKEDNGADLGGTVDEFEEEELLF